MVAENPLAQSRVAIVDGTTFYRRPAEAPAGSRTSVDTRPPVLLLNGCALPAAGWMPVIEGLGDREVWAMDRSGFAGTPWSGQIPALASEIAMVQRIIEHNSRLASADVAVTTRTTAPAPVILVAHSMAAFRAEALARLRPDLVAGIVLVDPSIESYANRGLARAIATSSWRPSLTAALTPENIRELLAWASHRGFLSQIVSGTELDTEVFKDPYLHVDTLKSALAEWLSYRDQGAELTTLRASTMEVAAPTSVIFAPPFPNRKRERTLERSFAALRTNSIADSGHLMMIDRPDVIIRAVEEIML